MPIYLLQEIRAIILQQELILSRIRRFESHLLTTQSTSVDQTLKPSAKQNNIKRTLSVVASRTPKRLSNLKLSSVNASTALSSEFGLDSNDENLSNSLAQLHVDLGIRWSGEDYNMTAIDDKNSSKGSLVFSVQNKHPPVVSGVMVSSFTPLKAVDGENLLANNTQQLDIERQYKDKSEVDIENTKFNRKNLKKTSRTNSINLKKATSQSIITVPRISALPIASKQDEAALARLETIVSLTSICGNASNSSHSSSRNSQIGGNENNNNDSPKSTGTSLDADQDSERMVSSSFTNNDVASAETSPIVSKTTKSYILNPKIIDIERGTTTSKLQSQTETRPPESQTPNIIQYSRETKKTFSKKGDSFVYSRSQVMVFLLPFFDGKGRWLSLNNFEKEDIEAVRFSINGLHPKSLFCTASDLFFSINYMAIMWYIPFFISFTDFFPEQLPYLSVIITIIFLLESIIALITPQPTIYNALFGLKEFESFRPTLYNWMQKWVGWSAIVEVVTIIPFELLVEPGNTSLISGRGGVATLMLMIRLIRLIRIPQMCRRCAIYTRLECEIDKLVGMSVSKVVPILIGMIFFLHYNACSVYYFGQIGGFVGWNQFDIDTNSTITNLSQIYSWSLFQAVGNMFPHSYNPSTAIEQIIESIYIVLAAVLYAAFLGAISSATMSVNPFGRLYDQKIEELQDYCKSKNLNKQIEHKLFSYFEARYRGKYFDENMLLLEMNESLRVEISLQNARALIEKVPFLRRVQNDGRDEIFLGRVAMALKTQYYVAGDCITKQGDSGLDMFFVISGKVDVFVNGKKVVSLCDGAYIGGKRSIFWFVM
ncbi:hypothetical protein HK100_003467 [Physocladia obscura]|uniref:Cyclic nucleotide-binding domain-containing protein n=1 Tax=Physocladia obscura TaxID=109957 RepID=A0AAD5SW53_9FUNG|nr:hypothetical protein HK100_003467 [Physocladia obscura]